MCLGKNIGQKHTPQQRALSGSWHGALVDKMAVKEV